MICSSNVKYGEKDRTGVQEWFDGGQGDQEGMCQLLGSITFRDIPNSKNIELERCFVKERRVSFS